MIMKKFKMTDFEVSEKEYKVEDQDVIPSMVDTSKMRGGVGNPFLFDIDKGRLFNYETLKINE